VKARQKVIGAAAGAAGVLAAGATARLVQQGRRVSHRDGRKVPFGSLRSDPITVVADDGVPLHAEIDEPTPPSGRRRATAVTPTLVFVHGFALNMDCWHFQRAAYRGRVRAVYYDQRSHGRSARSPGDRATLDQLGRDLARVVHDLTGDEPVVLVGHSMGGMTLLSLAEQHPELFGTKIVGAALISTTAGGLDIGRILFPLMPAGFGPGILSRVVTTLSRGSGLIDRVRGYGRDIATVLTDNYAFGTPVPASYVEFVHEMLDATPFSVVADFFPAFAGLDKWTHLEPFARVPTAIICGTGDKVTGVAHSRKLHSRIAGSDLLECADAGHLVILESHDQVGPELDDLVSRAVDALDHLPGPRAGSR
jgi:pimeloyl-ACP methyl ester carboxylesterase